MIPPFLVKRLDALLREQLESEDAGLAIDFTKPAGEAALAEAVSVSWQVFRNPVSLLIGGIAAVLLELAEPRVRSGVWEYSSFATDPLRRMRRTGMAAMVTVYGARSTAEQMIAGIGRMHAKIQGTTPDGIAYRADDPVLLRWVHATALFGFLEAYHQFVRPVPAADRDRFIAEGVPAALLYGALDPPSSETELLTLFDDTLPDLEPSEIVHEFLRILRGVELFPRPLKPMTGLVIRAAVSILPQPVQDRLGLRKLAKLPPGGGWLLRTLGSQIDRLPLDSTPAARSCLRMGLPSDYLAKRRRS